MKKFVVAAAFALLATVSLGGQARAQDAKQDFDLTNKTGYELKEVYVSPSKADEWGDDILGEGVMPTDQVRHIHFSRSTKTCKWDLKVVYTDDGSNAVWHDINLCEVEKITIHYNRSSDSTSATFD